jgi:hypothetical protein
MERYGFPNDADVRFDESVEHVLDALADQEWALVSDPKDSIMVFDFGGRTYRVVEQL